jgi:hypothetical protein
MRIEYSGEAREDVTMMKRKLFSLLAIVALGLIVASASAQAAPVDGSEPVIGEQKAKPAPTPTPKLYRQKSCKRKAVDSLNQPLLLGVKFLFSMLSAC